MAKHDAVDRLMAMATEKRADRTPKAPAASLAEEVAAPPLPATTGAAGLRVPAVAHVEQGGASAGERGRQLWNALRPMLPMVAGALRMVDHGAVQAVARLLPLIGGGAAAGLIGGPDTGVAGARVMAARAAAEEDAKRTILALQTAQQAGREEIDSLRGQAAEFDEQLRRIRTQIDRTAADEATREQEARALGDRVRLLTATTIILLMLVVAQMILLVVIFHR